MLVKAGAYNTQRGVMHLLRHEGQPEHRDIANQRKGVLECLPQRQLHFLCPLFMRGLLLRTGPANGLRDNSWALIGSEIWPG